MPVTSRSQSCLYCLSCLFVFVVSIFSVFSLVSLNSLWKSVEGYLIRCAQPTSPHRFLWMVGHVSVGRPLNYVGKELFGQLKMITNPCCLFLFRLERQQRTMRVTTTPIWKMTLKAPRTQALTALIKSIILKITKPLLRTCNLFHLTIQIRWSQILEISRKKSMLVGHLVDLAW